MKSGATHTSFHQGTTVFVILRNGHKFKDKFLAKKGRYIQLAQHGKINNNELRSVSVWRAA